MSSRTSTATNNAQVVEKARDLNYTLQRRSNGASILSVQNDEDVELCASISIAGLHATDLRTAFESFFQTAMYSHQLLAASKRGF